MLKSVFLMACFGFSRIGELVCNSKKEAQRSFLMILDVEMSGNKIKLRMRYSKTDQMGKSCEIIITGSQQKNLCPVSDAKGFIAQRGRYAGPLYSHFNHTFLSRFQFHKVLHKAMKFVAQDVKNVKSHSFRIGGATNAMCKGIPYETIKSMGRWKSEAAKCYIRIPVFEVNKLT
jgi:hypothetical protein